jgi:hypothetical protein
MLEIKKVSVTAEEIEKRKSNPLIQVLHDTIGGIVDGICDVGWVCAPIAYPCAPTLTCVPAAIIFWKKCDPNADP